MAQTYYNMEQILKCIRYTHFPFKMCADLKVVALLTGFQSGYTKYNCFLCLWDSRDRANHYVKQNWPPRTQNVVGRPNVANRELVKRENIIFPPLHIKLGLMKQFVKKLPRDGSAFQFLQQRFPKLSDAKIKEGSLLDHR